MPYLVNDAARTAQSTATQLNADLQALNDSARIEGDFDLAERVDDLIEQLDKLRLTLGQFGEDN